MKKHFVLPVILTTVILGLQSCSEAMFDVEKSGPLPLLIILAIFISFCYLVLTAIAAYAERNGHNKTFWVIMAIIITPVLAAFLLFLHGETKEHRKLRIIEEELWKRNCETKVKKEAE